MDVIALAMLNGLKKNGGVGYTEHGKVIVDTELPEILDAATQSTGISAKGNEFEVGKSYTVTTDSGTYSTVCKHIVVGEQEAFILGNTTIFGMEDTGEPFVVMLYCEDEQWGIGCVDFNSGTHMKVEIPEIIHPIDQKYLPGGSIRMDAYGNSEMTVNDALLNLALEGGGTTTFASGMEPFWADVLAKQPDYLIFNVGDNLRMPICVLYATEGSVRSGESCISANGLLSLYGTNLLGYFVMAQTKDGKGVKISVKSEPVIFPETALAEHGGE